MPDTRAPDLTQIDAIADADVGHVVDTSDTTSHAEGTSKKYTFSQLLTYARTIPGFSILAKQGTGTGAATALALAAQSLIIRAAGDIVALAVGEREVVGRAAGGNLGAVPMDTLALLVPGDASRVRGADLTDDAETLLVADGGVRVLTSGTLEGETTRAKTLGTTGATLGRIMSVVLLDDNEDETTTLVNGGAGAGTLVTHSGIKAIYEFRFDGTNWVLSGWDIVA